MSILIKHVGAVNFTVPYDLLTTSDLSFLPFPYHSLILIKIAFVLNHCEFYYIKENNKHPDH